MRRLKLNSIIVVLVPITGLEPKNVVRNETLLSCTENNEEVFCVGWLVPNGHDCLTAKTDYFSGQIAQNCPKGNWKMAIFSNQKEQNIVKEIR